MVQKVAKKSRYKLPDDIDRDKLPSHIAVIMDGNGRWAKKRKLPRLEGHRAGSKAVRRTVEAAASIGITNLTLFAFSTENWSRPEKEVKALMTLLDQHLDRERVTVLENNILFKVIGSREGIKKSILQKIISLENDSAGNDGMIFNLAINYSGRSELVDTFKRIADKYNKRKIDLMDISESLIEKYLYTTGQRDPDLLIRTSGELRISNFLLWQLAYTELWMSEVLWPDFNEEHLFQAIRDFQKRERRFGRIG